MLAIQDISFSYFMNDRKKKDYQVLRNLNIDINANEFISIIGPSGCGKSTLLKIIAGFEDLQTGQILYNGEEIKGVSYERAMVFQEDAVFPWLSVYDNIQYGLKVRKVKENIRKERTEEYIDIVGLRGFEKSFPKELSGGMKKRVDLARVLANNPKLILMDEPFGALDAMTKEMMQEELVKILRETPKTVLFVTHDIEEALFLADRIIVLQDIKNGGEAEIIDVDFERPRTLKIKEDPKFQGARRTIVELLKKYENA